MSGGGARGHKDKFLPLDPTDPSAQYGPYVPGRDGPVRRCGPTELGLVRSLIYPDGFAAEGDGGVKLVKGGNHPSLTTYISICLPCYIIYMRVLRADRLLVL